MDFSEFKLSTALQDAIKQCDYSEPTEIQIKAIDHLVKGKDMQAIAPTGSGKTAAFTLPIIEKLYKENQLANIPKALILVPTRELASQINENIQRYAINTNVKSLVIFGGEKIEPQKKKLSNPLDIIVATPGRLAEHIKDKSISLDQIEYLVLDEADTMLDMGFSHEIDIIFNALSMKPQTMLFSATLGESIKDLSAKVLEAPVCINVDKKQKATKKINQSVYFVSRKEKKELIAFLIGKEYLSQFIVFTRTKEIADEVNVFLQKAGLKSDALHGDKSHANRMKTINSFKENNIQVMVATDITARGIDIQGLEYIINYDIPNGVDDYIHRIGRTGRAGRVGNAISLVSSSEIYSMKVIERKLQFKFKEKKEEGFGEDIRDGGVEVPNIIAKKEKSRKTAGAFGHKKQKKASGVKKKKTTKRDRAGANDFKGRGRR